jgi:hypothetical protein
VLLGARVAAEPYKSVVEAKKVRHKSTAYDDSICSYAKTWRLGNEGAQRALHGHAPKDARPEPAQRI